MDWQHFFMNLRWVAGMISLLPQTELVGGQSSNVSANTCLSPNHPNAALPNLIEGAFEDLCNMKATGQQQVDLSSAIGSTMQDSDRLHQGIAQSWKSNLKSRDSYLAPKKISSSMQEPWGFTRVLCRVEREVNQSKRGAASQCPSPSPLRWQQYLF